MYDVRMTEADVAAAEEVISSVTRQYDSIRDPEFLGRASIFAQQLPERLRAALSDFRLAEPDGACRVSGFTVNDERIGDTPSHWPDAAGNGKTLRENICFVLCAALLGDIFGWASQQGGRLVHQVVPIRGHEDLQINSASTSTLLWHTEDAFHPYRADYIGLMCLHNPGGVGTTLACMQDVRIEDDAREILSQPRFILRPDESHLPKNRDP